MGIVPTKDPERLSDLLYHVKGGDPCAPECGHHLLPSPFRHYVRVIVSMAFMYGALNHFYPQLNSPHIPVLQPIINRRTLQELD